MAIFISSRDWLRGVRIDIARVKFNGAGDPCAVERLGVALEPEADYERRSDGGACEEMQVAMMPTPIKPATRAAFGRRPATIAQLLVYARSSKRP